MSVRSLLLLAVPAASLGLAGCMTAQPGTQVAAPAPQSAQEAEQRRQAPRSPQSAGSGQTGGSGNLSDTLGSGGYQRF